MKRYLFVVFIPLFVLGAIIEIQGYSEENHLQISQKTIDNSNFESHLKNILK